MIGIDRLLDVIAGSAPSPSDLSTNHVAGESYFITEEAEPCDPRDLRSHVFRHYVDPYAGRLSVLRIVSGRCRSDEALTNPRTGSSERLGGISHLVGKEREPVDEAVAGTSPSPSSAIRQPSTPFASPRSRCLSNRSSFPSRHRRSPSAPRQREKRRSSRR